MSTRSHIAIQNADGTIESVYAHWDGYLSNNGRILLESYNTENAVRELISKGDVSSLGDTVDETDFYATRSQWEKYSRDEKDEPWKQVKPKKHESLNDFQNYLKDSWTEFIYIFDSANGKWKWNRPRPLRETAKLHNLTQYMVENSP